MQASYASSHIGYTEKHENHPIRFRMPHAYFLEGNGGAKRRSCRPDGGAYGMPSPCRIPSVRPPTSNCRPQGGRPYIERTRDAHGRSNVLRPLQRHFKAQKSPSGTHEYPNGLKTSQNAKYSVLFLRLVFSHESEMTERIQNRLALLGRALRLLLVA